MKRELVGVKLLNFFHFELFFVSVYLHAKFQQFGIIENK